MKMEKIILGENAQPGTKPDRPQFVLVVKLFIKIASAMFNITGRLAKRYTLSNLA